MNIDTVRVENTSFCLSRICHDASVAVVLPSLRLTVLSLKLGVATIFPSANLKGPRLGGFRSIRDIGNTRTFEFLPAPMLIPPSVPWSSLGGRRPHSQACWQLARASTRNSLLKPCCLPQAGWRRHPGGRHFHGAPATMCASASKGGAGKPCRHFLRDFYCGPLIVRFCTSRRKVSLGPAAS
jgi:hypothetical protein